MILREIKKRAREKFPLDSVSKEIFSIRSAGRIRSPVERLSDLKERNLQKAASLKALVTDMR